MRLAQRVINWPWFMLSMAVIALDQSSKYWAIEHLSLFSPKPLMPMLSLTLAYNTGAAFSFLSETGSWHQWFFIGFSLIMSIVLVGWILRSEATAYRQLIGLSLLLGGAIGNLIDRFHFGHVIDFIDIYYKIHHWPVFNIADSAICMGAALLLIDSLRGR